MSEKEKMGSEDLEKVAGGKLEYTEKKHICSKCGKEWVTRTPIISGSHVSVDYQSDIPRPVVLNKELCPTCSGADLKLAQLENKLKN